MIREWLSILAELPPAADVLLKMSLILALGWILQYALLRANPRWRVLLWRGVALGVLAVPLIALALPVIWISIAPPPSTVVVQVPAPPLLETVPEQEFFAPSLSPAPHVA